MARPTNSALRTDILGAFDQQPICSINNVVAHLNNKHSYQSVRRTMIKLAKSGVIKEIPGASTNNQKFYTKNIFENSTRFMSFEGENVSLKAFIHNVVKLGTTDESALLEQMLAPVALETIKHWILHSLASCDPEAYTSKNLTPPDRDELNRKLDGVLEMLSQLHAFLKTYRISPVDDTRLAAEFKAVAIEELTAIVDRTWTNTKQQE